MRFRWLGRTRDERGATAVEYALLIALLAMAILGSVALLGNAVGGSFNEASDAIDATAEQVGNGGPNGANNKGKGVGIGDGVGGGQANN